MQTLALERTNRLLASAIEGEDPITTARDAIARHTLFAKLDSLIELAESSTVQDAVVHDIREEVTRWDTVVIGALTPSGIDSRQVAAAAALFPHLRERFDALQRTENSTLTHAPTRDQWLRTTWLGAVIAELAFMLGGLVCATRLVRREMNEVLDSQYEVLSRLAAAGEYRDDDTGQHTQRVGELSARIARAMGFSSERADTIRRASALHDVGKIGVPDSILLKPGKLTQREIDVMRKHTIIGHRILDGGRSHIVAVAARIARSHHECWDGTGYPDRLAGNEIPIEARITAVADVFDAIRSKRAYRDAWSLEISLDEIRRRAGTHFDPNVVKAFFKSRCYEGYAVQGGQSQDADSTPLLAQALACNDAEPTNGSMNLRGQLAPARALNVVG